MEIECIFGDVELKLTAPESLYTCKVTSCNITGRGLAISAFEGNHEDGKNNDSVQGLWFGGATVHYIPKNLSQIFPNLVYLAITNCELKEVSAEDMIGLEKLEYFNLIGNKITTLPVDVFKNMINLKKVALSRNLVQKLNAKILEPIINTIEVFEMLNNPGINELFVKEEYSSSGSPYKLHYVELLEMLESNKINSQRFDDLFTSGKHSDFTIKVPGKEYKVHKNILASLSSVFDKMISNEEGEAAPTFDFKNFSQGAFEEFLRYFYTRQTPSEQNVFDLLTLANEFDVPDLKLQCEPVLVQSINPESALKLYNIADAESLQKLKRKAFEAIQESHPEIKDYIYDKPKLVNQLIEAKEEFQAKEDKVEK